MLRKIFEDFGVCLGCFGRVSSLAFLRSSTRHQTRHEGTGRLQQTNALPVPIKTGFFEGRLAARGGDFFECFFEVAPRCPQDAPKTPQDALKTPPRCPKRPPRRPRARKMEPKWKQVGTQIAPNGRFIAEIGKSLKPRSRCSAGLIFEGSRFHFRT